MDKKIFPDEPEIPILPNLFTAGNLVCGFFAILTIFEGINQADSDAVAAFAYYQNATFLTVSYTHLTLPTILLV